MARELQNRIPDAYLIPIVSLLSQDVVKTKAKTVGFVFPIYITLAPVPVRKFMKKLDITSTEYIFTIITRAGTLCLAHYYVESILKKKGRSLDSHFILNMANNSPTGIKPTQGDQNWINELTKEKIAEMEYAVQHQLDLIQKIITNKEKYPEKGFSHPLKTFFTNLLSCITDNIHTEIKFYSDETCNNCRICEKVCLSGKIKIDYRKPVWQKNVHCFYCYACFNFCPEQAILVKKIYTLKNGRYSHPEITVQDIAGQKQV
ncbi:MAG: EFR1 family ferrodoxin [Spirochaetales bacterium]|nr:EFR1 family ferrodoxin [Spirochaetales bacterium]